MANQKTNLSRPEDRNRDAASWNLTDAKTQLSEVVRRALEGEPQRIVLDLQRDPDTGRDIAL